MSNTDNTRPYHIQAADPTVPAIISPRKFDYKQEAFISLAVAERQPLFPGGVFSFKRHVKTVRTERKTARRRQRARDRQILHLVRYAFDRESACLAFSPLR